ncbi:hypothetical protein BDB01DRAFT_794865 [Pilobolus umbonatus]|nr:hypothetical protein BDB01DRAFT_794865 [Pilobolus umbonatus]
MSDAKLPSVRPKHSRSTSVTTKKTTSHQRKASLNVIQQQQQLLQQQQQQQPQTPTLQKMASSENIKRHRSHLTSNNNLSSNSVLSRQSVPRLFNSLSLRLYSFLNPTGPLLPHSKQGAAFGGTAKPTLISTLLHHRFTRFFAFFYIIFSVFLTLNHTWRYLTRTQPVVSPVISEDVLVNDWIPQRTYDADKDYSLLDSMTHGVKMHKLFSKSHYDAAKKIKPFWLKSTNTPEKNEVSIITTVTADTWDELVKLTVYWEGPISALLHLEADDDTTMEKVKQAYVTTPNLFKYVNLHLIQIPGKQLSVLFPRNAERNLARLLAETDYVMDLPPGVIPASDIRFTIDSNRQRIENLLSKGDLLAIPTFSFKSNTDTDEYPYDKAQLLKYLDDDKVILDDKHWKENEGPTDLERWIEAQSLYAVEKYEIHYEPVVIESKTIQPWCSERFLDNRAACIFSSYLQGNEIWVLPHDYMIQSPISDEKVVSDFDNVVESRIYAKFYWEQCVHHARQLDGLGLWSTPKATHIKNQCARVIQNWGKGLIGKPE